MSVSLIFKRGDIIRYLRSTLAADTTLDAMDSTLEAGILKKIPKIFRKCTVLALIACMVQIAYSLFCKNGGWGNRSVFNCFTCRNGCFGITGTEGKQLFVLSN